jgi:ParB family chromosome partitioning protein
LLKLPKEAVEALQKNEISEGHARAILALATDENLQLELLNKIIVQKLSVRDAEQFVQQKKKIKTKKNSIFVQEILNKIDNDIKNKVSIREKTKGGVLSISYNDNEELKNIMDKLKF